MTKEKIDIDVQLESIKEKRWKRGECDIQGKTIKFVWGSIKNIYTVGEYDILEYEDTDHGIPNGEIMFHPYIKGRDTSHSYETLEEAMAGMIAIKMDGWNTRADQYFINGIKNSETAMEV